jgi:transposase
MDSDRRSAQVERLEVVETGRRRRWSEDEKLKIVLESLQAPRQVAATARRYGVSRSLLLRWRRSFRPEPRDAPQPGFVPAMVIAESGLTPCAVAPTSSGGSIEIEFAAGARMRITGTVDAATRALADGSLR